MGCDRTVDPNGTWQASYLALERAYAEGLVNSIGVSNFDINLLNDLENDSNFNMLPHIVQNFADFTNLDLDVREWCARNGVIYQPYASGRNIATLPDDIRSTVNDIATSVNQTAYAVQLRFFAQSGAVTIPRSQNLNHLADNLLVFNWDLREEDMIKLGWPADANQEL